jgi:fermentation-respiration switch protein FrsA (DUF1100 family)
MLRTCALSLAAITAAVAADPQATLIRNLSAAQVQAMAAQQFAGLPLPAPLGAVSGYRVTYPVTTIDGRTITVSGLLIDPAGDAPSIAVSLQTGTHFWEAESPSIAFVSGARFGIWPKWSQANEAVLLGGLGYTVLVPDGIGYAASALEQHPYLDRYSEVVTNVGLLAALGAIDAVNPQVAWDGRVFAYGYSAGGHATASLVAGLQAGALPGVTPIGAAMGAAPHDLVSTGIGGLATDAVPAAVNFGFVAHAWNRVYGWNRPQASIFQGAYKHIVPFATGGAVPTDLANLLVAKPPSQVFQPAFIGGVLSFNDLQFIGALAANSTLNVQPQLPVLLYHSAGDEVVPAFNSLLAYQAYSNTAPVVQLAPLGPDGQLANVGGHADPQTYGLWLGHVLGFLGAVSAQSQQ